ncbi:MAG: T9SS type A sorting domain-containing protein [bacterium]|nr:T9SS type A sorting domain-containing protein [bacterium]
MKFYTLIIAQIFVVFSTIYSQNTWERTNGLNSERIYSLAVNSSGDIFAGTDTTHYTFRSTDNGTSWINIGTDIRLDTMMTTQIFIKPSGEILISTLDHKLNGGIFHSTDNGITWSNLGYTGASTSIALNSQEHMYISTFNNSVHRSTNIGNSWVRFGNEQGLTDPNTTSIIINSNDHIFVGTISSGVFRSTNNGDNWIQINQGIDSSSYHVLSLAVNSSGHIFAGTSGGGVYRSTNNGDNWVPINQGLAGEGKYIRSILINPNSIIFAGTAAGVFRSTDNGDNWTQLILGLTNSDVYSLSGNSDGYIFAGTANGVFRSINPLPVELSSFTLKQMTDKIQLNWVTKTEVNNYGFEILRFAQNDKLGWNKIGFVQGNGNSNSPKYYSFDDKNLRSGKYSYRLKQIDTDGQYEYSKVIEVNLDSPMKYELSQNYPNPFNPVTTIQFSIPEAAEVNLSVYNILGEEVAVLINELKEAGIYTVNFNATELNSGLYVYKLSAGNYSETKKLMVIK